ncbi:cytochrome P450 [Massariosphaeria phaeospora]|uniref:Cytochrome P450 n=1 Tax=Massariosphaeria phaeospora TaxID=100035 RepID=A0A7C8I6W4_9PLEO|nr:cytochrome P450 [Massariosphaeria phaeospora]
MYPVYQYCSAGLCGILSHLLFFIRGEIFYSVPFIARVYFGSYVLLVSLEYGTFDMQLYHALTTASLIAAAYTSSLFASIIVYRCFFHRLKQFPGPPLAKLSKFYLVWHTARNLQQCLYLEELHKKYEDFIRTGPEEVTVFTPDGIEPLYGIRTRCSKSSWWNMPWPEVSMISTRSKQDHAMGRKAWEKGFGIKALRDYRPRMLRLIDRFVQHLKTRAGKSIDATETFECYTTDFMAETVFSLDFGMVRTGKYNECMKQHRTSLALLGIFTPVPWLFVLLASFPGLKSDWHKLQAACSEMLETRMSSEDANPYTRSKGVQVLAHIISFENKANNPHTLVADFFSMLAAANEPVFGTLVYIFYYLSKYPSYTSRLRDELEQTKDISDDDNLKTLRQLAGIINETLRLHLPVPSGGLRVTPPGGLMIGKSHIPAGVTIVIPQHSLGRREDCYRDAHLFVPERWYSRPNMILNRHAFVPFGHGNHVCLGQHLAKTEIRLAVARIVMAFDFCLAPGEVGDRLERDMTDCFVAKPGSLNMVFTERNLRE